MGAEYIENVFRVLMFFMCLEINFLGLGEIMTKSISAKRVNALNTIPIVQER